MNKVIFIKQQKYNQMRMIKNQSQKAQMKKLKL